MTSDVTENDAVEMAPDVTGDFSVHETSWGYIIRDGNGAVQRAAWGEIIAILASLTFGIAAYCQWLLPGTINSIDVLPFKIVGTMIFFVFAFLTYSIARKGLLYETQIDTKRKVVRFARRNRDGTASEIESHTFNNINRLYLRSSKLSLKSNQLMILPKEAFKSSVVAKSRGNDLDALLARMMGDVCPSGIQDEKGAAIARVRPAEPPTKPIAAH